MIPVTYLLPLEFLDLLDGCGLSGSASSGSDGSTSTSLVRALELETPTRRSAAQASDDVPAEFGEAASVASSNPARKAQHCFGCGRFILGSSDWLELDIEAEWPTGERRAIGASGATVTPIRPMQKVCL